MNRLGVQARTYGELCALADVEYGAGAVRRRERVAIGFFPIRDSVLISRVEVEGLGPVLKSGVWYPLENELGFGTGDGLADGGSDSGHAGAEFYVSTEQLQMVLDVAMERGMGSWTRVMWHSHYRQPGPSAYDLENFPGWLCDLGAVYYAPTMESALYSQGGPVRVNAVKAVSPIHATV